MTFCGHKNAHHIHSTRSARVQNITTLLRRKESTVLAGLSLIVTLELLCITNRAGWGHFTTWRGGWRDDLGNCAAPWNRRAMRYPGRRRKHLSIIHSHWLHVNSRGQRYDQKFYNAREILQERLFAVKSLEAVWKDSWWRCRHTWSAWYC